MNAGTGSSNLLFRLAAVLSGLFVITILALVASILGDPAAPVAQFLERQGGRLLLAEVAGILVTGICAMFWDRWRSLSAASEHRDMHTADATTSGDSADSDELRSDAP